MQSRLAAATYFESLYRACPDPWGYETSEYELQKYAVTLAVLPHSRYRSALEIGGSIGVLTQMLAHRCSSLLSIDLSPSAQARAKQRCHDLPQVSFEVMQVPQQFPEQQFDLILMSEVGYYLSEPDLQKTQQQILTHLVPQGQLLLVHWLHQAEDFCLSGEAVHECFLQAASLQPKSSHISEHYRIDLLERI